MPDYQGICLKRYKNENTITAIYNTRKNLLGKNNIFFLFLVAISRKHKDVYKRQLYNLGQYANNLLILFEFAAVIVWQKKKFP